MPSTVDTSSYPQPVNPMTSLGQTIQNGTGMVNLMMTGMNLHAQQAIGNAIATNTDPDTGQVDTNNMMKTVAQSGNPLAQQQAAQLAQNLQQSQSENQLKQVEAQNAKNLQMGNVFTGLANTSQGSMNGKTGINGLIADHIGQGTHSDLGVPINDVINMNQQLKGAPDDVSRYKALLLRGAQLRAQGGDISQFQASIDTTDPKTGQPIRISPVQYGLMFGGPPPKKNSTPQETNPPPINGPKNSGVPSPMADPTDASVSSAGSNPSMETSEPGNLDKTLNKAAASPPSQPPVMPSTGIGMAMPTNVAPAKAAGIKQMQSSVDTLNSDADSAYKQSFALQSAKQLLQSNPNSIGPVRAAVAQMVHTNPVLAEGISNSDNLADTQVLTKLLANAIPKAARSNEDQQVLDSQNPNPSMLYSAAMRAINYQMAQARMPIEKQKAIGPVLNNGQDASNQTTAWSSNNNPMVAEYAGLSPSERKAFASKLSDGQKQQLAQNIKALTSIGAFPELAIKKGSQNGQ